MTNNLPLLGLWRGTAWRTQIAAPPTFETLVRFYGVFEPPLRGAYGFVGRETDHERTYSFARALQLCIAYITLAAVDVRERKDERLRGKGGFLLGLGHAFYFGILHAKLQKA